MRANVVALVACERKQADAMLLLHAMCVQAIMLVESGDGQRALLGRGRGLRSGMYTCVWWMHTETTKYGCRHLNTINQVFIWLYRAV